MMDGTAIIETIKRQLIEQHSSAIAGSPDRREKIAKARHNYREVGMYKVVCVDLLKMMEQLKEVIFPALEGHPEYNDALLVFEDQKQKLVYATQSSMKSVSRHIFEKVLTEFQKPFTRELVDEEGNKSEEVIFLLDGLYLSDNSALIQFLQSSIPGDMAQQVVSSLSEEQLAAVFTLIKKTTEGIFFPACMIKRVDIMIPGAGVYDTFMLGLPKIMDQVFSSVLSSVGGEDDD